MLAGYLAGPRRRVGAAAGTAVLVLAVAGYYLADHLQGTYANLPGLPTDLVSDPVASSLRDAGFWTVGALLTGPPLGVLGALGQRAGVGGLLARLGAPALAIAELGMLVVTGTPRTALEETAQIAPDRRAGAGHRLGRRPRQPCGAADSASTPSSRRRRALVRTANSRCAVT